MSKVIFESPEIALKDNEYWCPKALPSDVKIEWDFMPVNGTGSAALTFSQKDENAFHVLYFRREDDEQKRFHLCHLIKDLGGNIVATGADPLPDISDNPSWYHMTILKKAKDVVFFIDDLEVLYFSDDGLKYGDYLTGGTLGIRHSSTLKAQYRNLRITWI
jgi:hypothetical protein